MAPSPQYLARFNGHVLPGYVQTESFDSEQNIADHYAAYIDGSNSEDTGLSNKNVSIKLKVWEQDYLTCKTQIELAATMLRSVRLYRSLLHSND
jgi:prophage DNA circulation protein